MRRECLIDDRVQSGERERRENDSVVTPLDRRRGTSARKKVRKDRRRKNDQDHGAAHERRLDERLGTAARAREQPEDRRGDRGEGGESRKHVPLPRLEQCLHRLAAALEKKKQ